MNDEAFISTKVQSLLSHHAKVQGSLRPPIEPEKMAGLCSVLCVEHRQMIPEGVLTPVPGGFKIYLQSNFANHPGAKFRRRFTLAHELAHTFFYELGGDVPKPKKRSPRGGVLERLCHVGASQILVPDVLLKQELANKNNGEVASAESIIYLAKVFQVSVEVIMRRIHETGAIAGERFAAVLVDVVETDRQLMKAACYGSMLLCNATSPKRGSDFHSWVRQLLPPSANARESEWTHETQSATITTKKVFRSKRSFILELRFDPPSRHSNANSPR